MRLIGITGGIACGKSTVSRAVHQQGYPVIDGDALSRELTGPRGAAIPDILALFGESFLLADGSMNRRKMSRLVFSEPKAREQLDLLMAPHLKSATLREINSARSSGAMLCFLDMPLLFEKGYDQLCDSTWCIWLPEHLQIDRLMQRDGYSEAEALSRIRSMMSSDEKANRASAVIDNSGTIEKTMDQLASLLEKERQRAMSSPRRRRASPSEVALLPQIKPGFPHAAVEKPESSSGFARPDASRKKSSDRRVSWVVPVWLRTALISVIAVLLVCFSALQLMNAYLFRQQNKHVAEQTAIDEQYPLRYNDIILRISSEYNLSPALVASVIRNESSFRPEAESSVGARGLMQLMPDTANWIAGKLRIEQYSQDQLNEPETNIRFGCWYLNYLCTLFRSDPLCVICAYHAGQGEISGWLTNPLISSDGLTMIYERLPEGPTKTYAGRVMRDYGIYQAKYYLQNPHDSSDDDVSAD